MTGERPIELFAYWRTSATYRVRVALALKGLGADERMVDLEAGEQNRPAFLAVNPLAAIPALRVPGHPPITQSLAILEFLDETTPDPPLLPADPHGRARVRSLCGMLAADTHPLLTARVKRHLAATGGIDDSRWRAWQTHWLCTGLEAVERRLSCEPATGAYCHGDRVTMADICLASITAMLPILKISVAGIPTIDRITGRCQSQPAFAKADPFKQAGAPAPP